MRITADGDARSRLALSHICPVNEFWQQYGPGAAGVGWDLGLIGLAFHLLQPGADRFDEETFAAASDGEAFIAGSSEDWGRAAVAAGEDPRQAEAAVKQTTAFYTGEPAQES